MSVGRGSRRFPPHRGYSGLILQEVYCAKAAHVAVILDLVLGPVEMAAAVLQCPGGSNGEGRSRTPWSECGRAR